MDPRVYLELADVCLDIGEAREEGGEMPPMPTLDPSRAEEWYRTCVNRSYYAAYAVAESYLSNLGFGYAIPRTGYAHELVRAVLMHSGVAELELAGKQLENLYRLRTRADYRHEDPTMGTRARATQATSLSGRIIRRIDQVTPEPDRARILEFLQQHRAAASACCHVILALYNLGLVGKTT